MVSPFVEAALQGMVGITTATFYKLNAVGIPTGLIADINPLPTENRIQLDMIDSESSPDEYEATDNPLQDFTSATSNVHKLPGRMSIAGTISSEINLGLLGAVGIGNIPGAVSPFRKDLQVLDLLRALADRREPIMVVTPRRSFPMAVITLIDDNWTPELGQNTQVTVNVKQVLIVNPLGPGSVILDVGASNTGNNAVSSAGGQSGTPIGTQQVTAPPAQGAAPSVVAVGG